MGLRRDVRADVLAGVGVAVISVLLAAPVGLLWAAVSPQADVQIVNAQRIGYVDQVIADFDRELADLLTSVRETKDRALTS